MRASIRFSPAREDSRPAKAWRTPSPISWPSASLVRLKPLRSRNTTARAPARAGAASASVKAKRLGRPVSPSVPAALAERCSARTRCCALRRTKAMPSAASAAVESTTRRSAGAIWRSMIVPEWGMSQTRQATGLPSPPRSGTEGRSATASRTMPRPLTKKLSAMPAIVSSETLRPKSRRSISSSRGCGLRLSSATSSRAALSA